MLFRSEAGTYQMGLLKSGMGIGGMLLAVSYTHLRRAETPRDYFATLDFLPAMKPLFEGYDD